MDNPRALTVLIVDDELPVLDAFEAFFSDSVDLLTAHDGQSAIELIDSGAWPDVIVCDYRMPGMNGVDVIRLTREIIGRDVPAIIMSGDTSAEIIEAANLAHCTMLAKPFDAETLIALILQHSDWPKPLP